MKKYKCKDCGKTYLDKSPEEIVNEFSKQTGCKIEVATEDMIGRLCKKCSAEFSERIRKERERNFSPIAIKNREEIINKINKDFLSAISQ